ncbi:tetratricopeptide repeat protein, partial [bacterium]|nr:tetratricopeptide repeat protein [bacterium]
IYIDSKNWNVARSILENILAVKKEDKAAIMSLAFVYQQEGYVNRALEMYLMAASFDPLDPTPLFHAGELYMSAGSYKSAISQFERVIKINKNFPRVYSQMGRAALENKDYERAIELAKIEKEMNPSLAEPYILTAEAYYKQEQYQECASEYQKAIMRRSQGTDIFIQMARCYRLAGALDPAIQMLDKAAQLESGNANIYKELGAVYHVQGQLQQAYSAYERYLHLAPNANDRASIERVMKELQ